MNHYTEADLLREAYLYSEGLDGYPQDLDKALSIYKLAKLQDHPDAQFGIGLCLSMKYSADKDRKLLRSAEGWFQLAAQNGSEEAMVMLGKSMLNTLPERLKWLCVAMDSPSPHVATMAHEEFDDQICFATQHDLEQAAKLLIINYSQDGHHKSYLRNLYSQSRSLRVDQPTTLPPIKEREIEPPPPPPNRGRQSNKKQA